MSGKFIVSPKSNASKLSIGQERDAVEHPGVESFDGEISRLLIYERPPTNNELATMCKSLLQQYNIDASW